MDGVWNHHRSDLVLPLRDSVPVRLRHRLPQTQTGGPETTPAGLQGEVTTENQHIREWVAAHPQYRLEINRSTGTPVGLEAALSGAES